MQNFHDLVGGFHHFRANYFLKEKEFFEALAHSQSPKTMVIACCDSRTDPAIVLGCKPGDLFVVRSVAAIVPPAEKAGEYDDNHKLLGMPFFGEVRDEAPNYLSLLQIDEDERWGLRFYDCGMLNFLISKEDLAAKRFDKVKLYFHSL